MTRFISGYSVTYSNNPDAPQDAVREITGQSNDFNDGLSGKHVWIFPTYTDHPHEAIGGLAVLISPCVMPGYNDVAPGSGGDFRYLVSMSNNTGKVIELGLFRVTSEHGTAPGDWDGISMDFNYMRDGGYLYIVWKTAK